MPGKEAIQIQRRWDPQIDSIFNKNFMVSFYPFRRIYGVEHKITFVVADFMALAPALKADVIFLSPPWGGPEYGKVSTFDLETMIPMDGIKLFQLAKEISSNIAYYVPRNVDRNQVSNY